MSQPDEQLARAIARQADALHQRLVIDIESWPVDIRQASNAQVQDTLDKMIKLVDWMHNECPGLQVGFYGVLPICDYWTPAQYFWAVANAPTNPWAAANLPQFQQNYLAWQAANARLSSLASHVDFVAPSIYTFYDDSAGWQTFAQANMDEAKKYGKPVLPFVCMYYHDSNPTLVGQQLSADYWQLELNTVRASADGIIVWGGWQQSWDSAAPWWIATLSFIAQQ